MWLGSTFRKYGNCHWLADKLGHIAEPGHWVCVWCDKKTCLCPGELKDSSKFTILVGWQVVWLSRIICYQKTVQNSLGTNLWTENEEKVCGVLVVCLKTFCPKVSQGWSKFTISGQLVVTFDNQLNVFSTFNKIKMISYTRYDNGWDHFEIVYFMINSQDIHIHYTHTTLLYLKLMKCSQWINMFNVSEVRLIFGLKINSHYLA